MGWGETWAVLDRTSVPLATDLQFAFHIPVRVTWEEEVGTLKSHASRSSLILPVASVWQVSEARKIRAPWPGREGRRTSKECVERHRCVQNAWVFGSCLGTRKTKVWMEGSMLGKEPRSLQGPRTRVLKGAETSYSSHAEPGGGYAEQAWFSSGWKWRESKDWENRGLFLKFGWDAGLNKDTEEENEEWRDSVKAELLLEWQLLIKPRASWNIDTRFWLLRFWHRRFWFSHGDTPNKIFKQDLKFLCSSSFSGWLCRPFNFHVFLKVYTSLLYVCMCMLF